MCRDTIESQARLHLYEGYHRVSRKTSAICRDTIEYLG